MIERPPMRYLGSALDARRIAKEIMEREKSITPPKRKSTLVSELARRYSDALVLVALHRLEKLLEKSDLNAKDAISILSALEKHSEWARANKNKRKPGRPPKEKEGPAAEPEVEMPADAGAALDDALGLGEGANDATTDGTGKGEAAGPSKDRDS